MLCWISQIKSVLRGKSGALQCKPHVTILQTIASNLITELTTTVKNILPFEIYIINIKLKGIHLKLRFKNQSRVKKLIENGFFKFSISELETNKMYKFK